MGHNQTLLSMREVAQQSGLTPRMIHLHEERGLISSIRNSETGNRYFTEDTIARLKKIKQLQAIGLSIKEIISVFPFYMDSNDHGIKGKQKAIAILRQHLQETDEKLAQLNTLRDNIIASIARLELLLEQYQNLNNPDER